jgi:hypothetical protein
MMIIDMTPQFAVIAGAMNAFLVLSAGALVLAVARESLAGRARAARRLLRVQTAARA